MRQHTLLLLSGAALLSGCATKAYVRENVDPLQTKLDQVAQQLQQTQQNVEKNTTAISATDEKATSADLRATDAINGAKQAKQTADQNSQEIRQLRKVVANIDNYKVTDQCTVLFPVNSAKLDAEGKQELDHLVSNTNSLKRYFLAVAGYTDQSGSPEYNLALSRRRTDAVVLYLASQRNVPFYQMRTIGFGERQLVDDGISREARAMSRRVEVRIYSADDAKNASANSN